MNYQGNETDIYYHYYYSDNYSLESEFEESEFEEESKGHKDIDDIINLYMCEDKIMELIPLPISDKDLSILKGQWNKQFNMITPTTCKNKNIWNKFSNSFKNKSKKNL